MQTDYIDLYWLHNWDVHTPIEETLAALDDLVRAGKVRYIGVSDTPAWKIAEANVTARFRGWSAFIGLQVEYPLLERTIEQELVPMALELGLGITPWSPLKSGALSGKYTRQNASAEQTGGRAYFPKHERDLRDAFDQIQRDLREQYLVAYSPSNKARDGSYRRIEIQLVNPALKQQNLKLNYRSGYFSKTAPTDAPVRKRGSDQ